MADRTEITLRLDFEDNASKGLGDVADKAKDLEDKAKKAQKQLTDLQEAHRRLAAQDRESRVRSYMDAIRPPTPQLSAHEQWAAQPWYSRHPIAPGYRGLAAGVAGVVGATGVGLAAIASAN